MSARPWPAKVDRQIGTVLTGKLLTPRRGTGPTSFQNLKYVKIQQTSQELRMLSSVTINCQVPKTVMISGPQLSEL
mgnify:CR=1 FL=1